MDKVKKYIDENKDRFMEELFDAIRIPSISSLSDHKDDMIRMAEYIKKCLIQAGADTVFEKVKFGKIKIKIAKEYKLADAKHAHEDLEARKLTGPAILIP